MATETSGSHPSGAAAEVKDKGEELVSAAQEQITAKAHELGGEANLQIREQLDQRSTQAGEQLQSIGSKTIVADWMRPDLDLLITVGRFWGAEAVTRVRFVEAPERHEPSRMETLLQRLRG